MWKVKNLFVFNVTPMLNGILWWVRAKFGRDFVTCGLRPGDKGVHGTTPLRGIDLRCWDKELGFRIMDAVNARWAYDRDRPWKGVCLFHKVQGGQWHLHFQTHPNTGRKIFKLTKGRYTK